MLMYSDLRIIVMNYRDTNNKNEHLDILALEALEKALNISADFLSVRLEQLKYQFPTQKLNKKPAQHNIDAW